MFGTCGDNKRLASIAASMASVMAMAGCYSQDCPREPIDDTPSYSKSQIKIHCKNRKHRKIAKRSKRANRR